MYRSEITDEETRKYILRRRTVSLISLGILVSLFVFIAVTVGKPLLNLASDPEHFRAWVESKGMWGRLFLVGIMCLQVVISLIPGEAIEIGAGYAFGAIEGMIWCLIGSAVGSAIIFAFTKVFGLRLVETFISREKLNSFKFIQNSNRLNFLVSMVYFIPGTPKDLFAYFVGLTPMKLKTFLLISTFMRIPSVITSTIGGQALGVQNYVFAGAVFAATALLSICGLIFYKRFSKAHSE